MKVTILIVLLGLLTIAPAIYYGNTLFDGKVTEKPYETGIDYNKINHIIENSGIELKDIKTVQKDGTTSVTFAFGSKDGVQMDGLGFSVSRPGSNNGKIELNAVNEANGFYRADFKTEYYGNFILEARAKVSGTEISLQKNFYINKI